ncbi:MAG: NrfD/PsrC family molybdoenzyme membrane anchor subunit [Desulfobacterales bacterium]|nr:NrfD/PsrC family molybdoenzyme membrane anchor subunit [Desulfobacterales bacterium]
MIEKIKTYHRILRRIVEKSPFLYIWISFLLALVFLGGFALAMSFIYSMEILEFYTNIPWEMMVSNYVFLVGSSVGLCLLAAMGDVFGLEHFKMIGRRSLFLSLVFIILGLSSIGLHLGHPERGAVYNVLTPNFRSAMWWMATFYPPYIVFIGLWYWLLSRKSLAKTAAESEGLKARVYGWMALEGLRPYLHRRFAFYRMETLICRLLPLEQMGLSLDAEDAERNWARVAGALALVFGFLAYTVEGSLFAHVEARPFWYGALYPVDFFLGASLCGLAWFMAMGIITYKVKGHEIPESLKVLFYEMADILVVLLSLLLLFVAYKMGHGLFEPAKAKTIMLFIKGSFSLAFWLFEVACGMVLPVGILIYAVRQKKITGLFLASVMVLTGYFVKRYDFVVASQVYPLIKKHQPLASYFPTAMETLVIGGILGAFLLIYTLGDKFLPLKEDG